MRETAREEAAGCQISEEHGGGGRSKSRRSMIPKEMTQAGSGLWAKEQVVAKANRSHFEKGLWAIDTVNPNCWNRAGEYLSCTAADAVCVQETRLPDGPTLAMDQR